MTSQQQHSSGTAKIGLRARVACGLGRIAMAISKLSGRGAGGMIGGEVARRIDPHLAAKLAAGKRCYLVTGTNGKSTTTKMLRAAIGTAGPVASNINGDNMFAGVLTALIRQPDAPYAVLEVDELHLDEIAQQVNPAGFVLLNLSRDQLDRTGEIANVERYIRQTVAKYPQAAVVANCDDPLIAAAAWDAPQLTWVSAGCAWTVDSVSFPLTGTMVLRNGQDWHVQGSDKYRRPTPKYWVDSENLWRDNEKWPLQIQLPGRANRGNAAQAVAAAVTAGIEIPPALNAIAQVRDVAGRYCHYRVGAAEIHLLLAKNPAGWQEALTVIDPQADTIVLGVNGQTPDGKDLSWLWDVDFEYFAKLPGQRVIACGQRGADLAVRLRYAGCTVELVDTPAAAVAASTPGKIEMLLNYTAFRDYKAQLDASGAAVNERREND